ncbi:hypothetical protein [Salipiger abyssi]|uniref:hypothetical protein n=1 Tax=Salipiger abyssi TaxID=1250539 RepID=UPI001A8D3FB8|nr:hypothetical protein [Salipiger abyssi]MBN9886679.1 hypothetical protein [Salipiger abyssi]
MTFMRVIVTIALAVLAGCGVSGDFETVGPKELQAAVESGRINPATPTPGNLALAGHRIDPQAPRPGYTVATDSVGNGIQIEYFAPDGRSYLWYPGNRSVVQAQYRYGLVIPRDGSAGRIGTIEFLYPSNSIDRTGRRGGKWEARGISDYRVYVMASRKGDIFNLSSGEVPYVRRGCDLPKPMIATPPNRGVCRR